MANFKFEWDYKAAGNIFLRSEEIADFCEKQAERMTRATGVEYTADVKLGKRRVFARGYDREKSEDGSYRTRSKTYRTKDGRKIRKTYKVHTQRKPKE